MSFKIDSKREIFCKKTVAYSGHESNDFDVIDSRNRKCFYFQFCHENENENESEIGIFLEFAYGVKTAGRPVILSKIISHEHIFSTAFFYILIIVFLSSCMTFCL